MQLYNTQSLYSSSLENNGKEHILCVCFSKRARTSGIPSSPTAETSSPLLKWLREAMPLGEVATSSPGMGKSIYCRGLFLEHLWRNGHIHERKLKILVYALASTY